jgi:diacylglycerol kinase
MEQAGQRVQEQGRPEAHLGASSYSIQGFKAAWRDRTAFRQEMLVFVLAPSFSRFVLKCPPSRN